MAVYGIGIDLVRVDRIGAGLQRWGARFLDRLFTPQEQLACSAKAAQVPCLAMRFAAKEAFAKALGTGIRAPLHWRDMEVRNDAAGRPYVVLSQRARRFVEERGVRSWHVSLTDDGLYGAAVVVLEGDPTDSSRTSDPHVTDGEEAEHHAPDNRLGNG
jgi:holo-[acyl-carrier protein] synthase